MPLPDFRPLSQLPKESLSKFWNYVLMGEPDECWPWLGTEGIGGYGQFFADHKLWVAHRVAFYDHYRIDPLNLDVCHDCDNPPCCNVYHLFAGTRKENVQDCIDKGRFFFVPFRIGSNHPNSKLTDDKVRLILELRRQGQTIYQLAAAFEVEPTNISHIVNRKTWRHIKVSGPEASGYPPMEM